jgi:hypothetical protein
VQGAVLQAWRPLSGKFKSHVQHGRLLRLLFVLHQAAMTTTITGTTMAMVPMVGFSERMYDTPLFLVSICSVL